MNAYPVRNGALYHRGRARKYRSWQLCRESAAGNAGGHLVRHACSGRRSAADALDQRDGGAHRGLDIEIGGVEQVRIGRRLERGDRPRAVARIAPGYRLSLNRSEVAEAFEVPLDFLMTPANHQRHSREDRGVTRHYYAMPYRERYIWGVTAGILRNMYERIYGG